MSIYRYQQSNVIDEITFRKTENGAVRAYLHAHNGVDASLLEQQKSFFTNKGLLWSPFSLDGKPTLELRGFSSEKSLTKMLAKEKWVEGSATIKLEKEDQISWWDKLKKRTLQASGVAYLIGDYGFFSYGRREADKLVMAGAFAYFLGTLSLVFYGRNDQSDLQVEELAKALQEFVADKNLSMPEGSALHEITKEKKKSLLSSMNDFGRRYPSEMFNTVTAVAGLFVAASAYKNKIKFKPTPGMDAKAIREMLHEGWMDFGLGTATTASGIFATVVKEKKPDPDAEPSRGLAWVWDKIREHPLAIAGGGYTISTMCHAASTWKAYWEAKRVNDHKRLASVPGRGLFVGMAFLSEFLLAISSKGHGEGVVSDVSVDESAIAIAADLIVKQPPPMQEQLIGYMGNFLGSQDMLAMDDKEVLVKLRKQVESLRHNPWAKPDAAPKAITPAATTTAAPAKAAWQNKVSIPPASQLQPSV